MADDPNRNPPPREADLNQGGNAGHGENLVFGGVGVMSPGSEIHRRAN